MKKFVKNDLCIYLCSGHLKSFFHVYLLSSFYIRAGVLGKAPAFFFFIEKNYLWVLK